MLQKNTPQDRLSLRLDSLSGQEIIPLGISLSTALESSVGPNGYHGGIRPDNIFIDGNKKVSLGERSTKATGELGPDELEYVCPEFFWSGKMSPEGDVYSLGLLLYAAFNGGRPPFLPSTGEITPTDRATALQHRMKGETVPALDNIDSELSDVIARCLSFRPEERWLNVQELRTALIGCNLDIASPLPPVKSSEEVFGKSQKELSTVELMMAEILGIESPLSTSDSEVTEPEQINETVVNTEPVTHSDLAPEADLETKTAPKEEETHTPEVVVPVTIPSVEEENALTLEETISSDVQSANNISAEVSSAITEPIIAEQLELEPVEAEQPIVEPVMVELPISEPVMVEEPQAEPVIAEQPNTEPVEAEEPVAEPVMVEQPIAEPTIAEEPIAEPVMVEEPQAEPVIAEQSEVEPVMVEEPQAEPVQAELPITEPVMVAQTKSEPVKAKQVVATPSKPSKAAPLVTPPAKAAPSKAAPSKPSAPKAAVAANTSRNAYSGNKTTGSTTAVKKKSKAGLIIPILVLVVIAVFLLVWFRPWTAFVKPSQEPEVVETPVVSTEPTPEATPDATPEPSPEATPDSVYEPSSEVINLPSPEITAAPLPAATPKPSKAPQPTPTPTPKPSATPTPTPEVTIPVGKYEVVTGNYTWEEAKVKCEELGGHLPIIKSQADLDIIIAVAEKSGAKYIWLGAQRNEKGDWVWSNGEQVEFFDWDKNEPSVTDLDGTPEDYLMLWKVNFDGRNTGWKFNDCRLDPASYKPSIFGGKIAFICQYD